MNFTKVLLLMLLSAFLLSCTPNRWDVKISDVEISMNYQRFDIDLFTANRDSIWQSVPKWKDKYGNFFEAYNQQIIKIGSSSSMDYDEKLKFFLTDPYIEEAYQDVQKIYNPLPFEKELTDAFRRYHYYFPDKSLPKIYTHISGFNQSIVIDSGYLSISLDKYLGADSKFYAMLRTPAYLSNNMHHQKICSDVMCALALTEFPFKSEKDDLLSHMIYYGKIQVFVDAMLPVEADSLKWGYSEDKLKWCYKNERMMWLYLVENKLLFNSTYKERKKYIDEGPFTATFSNESPARTGQWIGYRIVNAYMDKYPEVTLKQLMDDQNYQDILNKSKYKP